MGRRVGAGDTLDSGGTVSESEGYTNTRRSPRVEPPEEFVVLVESFGQFLEQHAKDVSEGGMFLRSAAPPPPGTRLRFAIRLADGYPLIQGEGEVVWRRERRDGPFEPPGMGVRFLSLEEQGRELVKKLVEERKRMLGAAAEDSPEAESGGSKPQPGTEARQALNELLDVLKSSSEESAAGAPEEEDPFGSLELSETAPPATAAGADLFVFDEQRGGETGRPEPTPEVEPRPVKARGPEPESPQPVPGAARGEEFLAVGTSSRGNDEASVGLEEMPEIGRPAGYYDDEKEPLPPARGRWFWPFAVPVALLALVALAYGAWQLGYLGWAGLPASGAAGITGQPPVETPVPTPAAATPVAEQVATAVGEAATPGVATPSPPPTATPSPVPRRLSPTALPAPASPATVVRRVSWKAAGGGVEVRLAFDGPVQDSRIRLSRLENPPRTLVRIRGIRRQYEPAEIGVGQGPLRRIRVWLHDELRPPELWVVLDLESSEARVSRRIQGSELVFTLR